MKIVVTRAKQDCQELHAKFSDFELIDFPCIEFSSPNDGYASLDQAIRENHHYDWVFFLSKRSAELFFDRLLQLGGHLFHLSPRLKIACVGQMTADFVSNEIGFPVNFVPSKFNSKTLAKEFLEKEESAQILLPRLETADKEFIEVFEKTDGFELKLVPAYQIKKPEHSMDELEKIHNLFESKEEKKIIFASSTAVENFANLVDLDKLSNTTALSIGPATSEAIVKFLPGLNLKEASRASFDGVYDLLRSYANIGIDE